MEKGVKQIYFIIAQQLNDPSHPLSLICANFHILFIEEMRQNRLDDMLAASIRSIQNEEDEDLLDFCKDSLS